ncbi:MAG: WG repeat-containing protein [Lentimicrobiaceae bacterium]|nr:WG repeat-containing protein [Lentimicrobiaceae bacterium]
MKKSFIFSALLTALYIIMTTTAFSQELEKIKIRGKWGYVAKLSHETVISCKYEEAKDFSEGLAAVLLSDNYSSNYSWGFIDKTGKEVIPFTFQLAESFSEGLAAVKRNGKWGFINKAGKEITAFNFQRVGNFSEGLAAVKRNGKWGFIDKTGEEVIPLNFQMAENFSEGVAAVKSNDYWGFIDNVGNEVLPFRYSEIVNYSDAREELERELALERERLDAQEREKLALEQERLDVQEREKLALERERIVYQTTGTVTTNAYDIILLKDGNEIKAIITEITPTEIKYKAFENSNGPTITLWKKDVFVINYANGTREIFNTTTETRISHSKRQNVTDCAKKTAFGLDVGIGGNSKYKIFAPALGIRVMHHFNPYFAVDFFKINWLTDVQVYESFNSWAINLQIMPGFRANSPTFFKCMSVYSAFRLGYGMQVASGSNISLYHSVTDFKGLCMETELGINLTPTFFAGFAYNYHKHFGIPAERHTFAFRVGFNFGK